MKPIMPADEMSGMALINGGRRATVEPLRNISKSNRSAFTARFQSAWKNAVAGIIEAGRVVIEAKHGLEHGQFIDWVEHDLRLGLRKAQMLMIVAGHPVLSNANHWYAFPSHPPS